MTYVKISELETMQELSNTDLLPIVDVSETETKKITKQNLLTDIDAGQVQIGQLTEATQINDEDYLIITQNGTNKKISKANAKFASGDEVYVGDTEPTGEDDDSVKLWIEPSEDSVDADGTYISNEYGIAQDKGYSQEYINKLHTYSTDETKTGETWIDGKPVYRKVVESELTGTGQKNIAHNITDVDNVISVTGTIRIGTTKEWFLSPMSAPTDAVANYGISIQSINDTNIIYFIGAQMGGNTTKYAKTIIEYTKTTD